MNSSPKNMQPLAPAFRYLLLGTAILAFGLIVVGVILRVSDSSTACLDWPTCSGVLTERLGSPAFLPYLHRIIAAVTGIGLATSLVFAWRRYRNQPWIVWPLSVASGLMAIQILLGRFVAVQNDSPIMSSVHFVLALGVLALTVIPLVILFSLDFSKRVGKVSETKSRIGLTYNSPFSRLTLLTLIAVLFLFISGTWVSASGAQAACQSWPLCGEIIPIDYLGWGNLVHRLVTLVAGILVFILLIQAWRTQRSQTGILVATTAAGVLFFSQAFMGMVETTQNYPDYLIGLHIATAAAVWVALVIQATLVGLAQRSAIDEQAEALVWKERNLKVLLKDYFEHIDDSLYTLSLRMVKLSSKIQEDLSNAHYNLDKSLENIAENRIQQGRTNQQYTMTAANNLADLLSDMLQSLQNQQPGSGKGKGKEGELSLPDIIKQQKNMMQKMKEGLDSQKGQGQKGKEELTGEQYQMYQEQKMIRDQLQELMDKEGSGGTKGKSVMQQMELLEKILLEKGVGADALQRMQQLEHELLELENAGMMRNKDTKREATSGEQIPSRRNIKELELDYLNRQTDEMLRRKRLEMSPEYREKVKKYFESEKL